MKMSDLTNSTPVNEYERAIQEQMSKELIKKEPEVRKVNDTPIKKEIKNQVEENTETVEQVNDTKAYDLDWLINGIKKEGQKGTGKNFYIDNDVQKSLKARAKKLGISESKLVNEILRSVLLGN